MGFPTAYPLGKDGFCFPQLYWGPFCSTWILLPPNPFPLLHQTVSVSECFAKACDFFLHTFPCAFFDGGWPGPPSSMAPPFALIDTDPVVAPGADVTMSFGTLDSLQPFFAWGFPRMGRAPFSPDDRQPPTFFFGVVGLPLVVGLLFFFFLVFSSSWCFLRISPT